MDTDSIRILTNFLEDNDFSEKNLSDNSEYQEYIINKKWKNSWKRKNWEIR